MADVKLPGIGNVDQKWVWAGGALVVGIVGYAYIRQSRGATDEAIEESGTEDYTADEFGYGTAYGTDYAYDGGYASAPPYYSPPPVTGDPFNERDPVNDMEWVSRVIEYLQALGIDGQTASLAVSKYRLKECLSGTQADIVRQAVGRWSQPPQSPNLTIITCPTPPPTVPPPASGDGSTARKAPTGLKAVTVGRTSVRLDWSPVGTVGVTPGLVGYQVWMSGKNQVTLSYSGAWTKSGLRPNSVYKFQVFAVYRDSNGNSVRGPGSAILSVRTKR